MGAKRIEYQIVGRYMSGKEVTGYHLQSIDTGKAGKYTKEQVCWLVGRDQVTNCTGQIYQDKVLLRGKGMSLEDLPVQYEDGDTRNMEQLGKIRKGTSAQDAMTQFMIVGAIKSGRNTVGYVVQNAGCGIKKLKRQQVIELASQGKIGNARVQNYNGTVSLRGVGCNLDELPSEVINSASGAPTKSTKPVSASGAPTKSAKPVSADEKTFLSICKYIQSKASNLIRPMNVVDKSATTFKTAYNAGFIKFDLTGEDSFRLEWEAANGFDGGAVSGNFSKDMNELKEYIDTKVICRIHTLMIH